MQAYRSPLLEREHAVEADGLDAGVAAHYGDPMREQRLLESGEGLVDLSNRGVVTVTGPDRLSWLNSMTSQKIDDLAPGVGTESLVLSPHGHVEHDLHLVDDGETTWITVEPGTAPALVEWLRKMQFMLRVEVTDRSSEFAVLGDPSTDTPPAQVAIAWVDPWPDLGPDTAAYSAIDPHPAFGRAWRELVVPRDDLEAVVGDRPLAGTWASEALREQGFGPWFRRLWFDVHVHDEGSVALLAERADPAHLVFGTNFAGWDSDADDTPTGPWARTLTANAERLLRLGSGVSPGGASAPSP